jgi:acetyl-CoA carboxylase carboxyltransferase component
LVPVDRPYGENHANVVVGVIRNFTAKSPQGMSRVIVLGDPSRGMGSLAEPECHRIIAALDLAEGLGVPLEWFAVSAGARISMDSGTENMDWIARVLRRLVEHTQAGGEVNMIVHGVNVGAQPYWNAEATMLQHTRGILIMTPEGSMVLTGKRALEYSGGVSAEDNQGIGGYERIMGVNGQGQYFARDVKEACDILMRRFPRRAPTIDPAERDVGTFPHGPVDGDGFTTVGEVFSAESNPGRKRPFDIRKVMRAVSDQDHEPLERWYGMRAAENAVVWDIHLGGYPVCLIGIESRPLPRLGFAPADGPNQWTAGTLFPLSSKKVARALNASTRNRPVVILANLSGFDGSPDSMRNLQLEYGAEIGRAVVNFDGPIVFCVVSRYHGGAFVVFSNALNENLEVAALEGTHASVIGGAPAAAVVFAREVQRRIREDARMRELIESMRRSEGAERVRLQTQIEEHSRTIRSEKLGEVADEFDSTHSVERAQEVGSVHRIVPPNRLRPYLIDAVERGMQKTLEATDESPLQTRVLEQL